MLSARDASQSAILHSRARARARVLTIFTRRRVARDIPRTRAAAKFITKHCVRLISASVETYDTLFSYSKRLRCGNPFSHAPYPNVDVTATIDCYRRYRRERREKARKREGPSRTRRLERPDEEHRFHFCVASNENAKPRSQQKG